MAKPAFVGQRGAVNNKIESFLRSVSQNINIVLHETEAARIKNEYKKRLTVKKGERQTGKYYNYNLVKI